MKIIESFHFMYEKEEYLKSNFNICRKHAHHGLEGIYATIKWLQSSIFKNAVKDITFYLSDEPINFPGELAIDDTSTFDPVIYINIMSVTEDFQNKEYLIDLKKKRTTCFEYASFILLHEVGHYIHALIGGNGQTKKDRILDYFDKGEYHYEKIY